MAYVVSTTRVAEPGQESPEQYVDHGVSAAPLA